jgi:pimeloyl-ACP methyl ester carboxylesterase
VPHRARIIALVALALVLLSAYTLSLPPSPRSVAFGRGSVVAFVHGLGGGSDQWLLAARRVAQEHRVVLVDLPGHGESAMPEPLSLARAAQALDLALLRETGGPVVLVGHSVGGLVAAAQACRRPGKVRALVLIETSLRPQFDSGERAAMLEALESDYQGLLRGAYIGFGRDSAQGEALYRQVAAMDPAVVKPWIRLALRADLSRRIAQLQCPLLVVLSGRSWPDGESWPKAAAALGYSRAPQVQAVRLQGSGHFAMLDRPARVADLILRFAEDLESGTDGVATSLR